MSDTRSLSFTTKTIADCLVDNVVTYGNHVAYTYKEHSWTWNQVNIASDIAADELSTMGIGHGDHVAIWSENSINWVIFLLAISKLHAVGVLLNPNYKREELIYALNAADVKLLCYSVNCTSAAEDPKMVPGLAEDSSVSTKLYFNISEPDYTTRFHEYAFLDFEYVQTKDPEECQNTAVILFTSGSTAAPKAVCLSSYNVVNDAFEISETFDYLSSDRLCLVLPMFHSFGLVGAFLGCLVKKVLVCIPPNMRTSTVLQMIDWNKCTMLHSVPTYFLALINNRSFNEYSTGQIRLSLTGGAPITSDQLAAMQKAFSNTHFINAYGMTETSPSISATRYVDTFEHIAKSVGLAFPRVEVELHSQTTNEKIGVGETGEIVVRGFNIMKGYLHLPKEKQGIDEDGWLHTGDLGQMASDGYLYIVGRAKEIIIRGGENIAPMEVEEAICSDLNVSMCKVLGAPDPFLGEQVIACIELQPRNTYNEQALRDRLAGTLAKFKIPSEIFVYPHLPLTANMKIDTQLLKKDVKEKLKELEDQKTS